MMIANNRRIWRKKVPEYIAILTEYAMTDGWDSRYQEILDGVPEEYRDRVHEKIADFSGFDFDDVTKRI